MEPEPAPRALQHGAWRPWHPLGPELEWSFIGVGIRSKVQGFMFNGL